MNGPTLAIPVMLVLICLSGCSSSSPFTDIDWQDRLDQLDDLSADRQANRVRPDDRLAGQIGDVEMIELDPNGELSLEQAVLLSVKNNAGLAVRQLEPVIAGTFEQIERAFYDPVVFAEIAYEEQEASETSRATGEQFNVTSEGYNVIGGVRQDLPTGTSIEATAETNRSFSSRTPDQHSPRLGLTLTQSLLQGRDTAANLVRIEQARLDVNASEYELRGFAINLIADTEIAFWQATLAQREIEIFQKALDVARLIADETRQRIEVGRLAEAEQAAADAEVALREQSLINARSRLARTQMTLLRLISPARNTPWGRQLTLVESPILDDLPLGNVADHVQLARLYRADVNEARIRLEQDRLEVIRTRDGLLPRLDFFIALGKTGFASSFSDSLRDVSASNNYDLRVGLAFEYPLGNRAAEARDAQALLRRRQSTEAVMNIAQLAELDVRLAYIELERAHAQVAATAVTRKLREQTLANEQEKLRVGKSTNLLIATAQRDLLEAAIREVEAMINLQIARIELYRLDGTLLTRRGITAPGLTPPVQ